MKSKIKFLINPSEITAGTRGSSLGPEAVMTAARAKGSYLFGENEVEMIPDENYLLDHPTKYKFAKRIDGLVKVFENVSNVVAETLNNEVFPIVLAADHGSAGGTIAGIKKAFPHKRLGVIWIDAHGDLHSPYTTPSGNMHGMPLSAVLNDDNLSCQSNEIDTETEMLWNRLKNLNGIAPKVKPEDLIFVGVRDVERQEVALMERLNIRNFPVSEVNEKGTRKIADEILELLSACDIIYLSFDVDSMDPEITSHGTGTPVPNGLHNDQAREMILELLQNDKIVCFEIVEVNPCLDEKINKMATITFEILNAAVAQLKAQ